QKKSRCSESARRARLLSEQRRCCMPFVGRPMPVMASAPHPKQGMRHAAKLDYMQVNQLLVISAHSLCAGSPLIERGALHKVSAACSFAGGLCVDLFVAWTRGASCS